jgi:hypothetical protein
MNQVDRLFNEKLSEHSSSPSASAWDRIEAGLAKKNSAAHWMRWAAVLVPAAVLGLLYLGKPETVTNKVAETKTPAQTVPVAVPVETTPVVTQIAIAPAKEKRSPKAKQKETQQVVPPSHGEQEQMTSLVEPVGPLSEIIIEPSQETVVDVAEEVKPLVLVYTLESIPPAEQDDQDEQKPTSLERVVEIAKTVKYSDPLGDLRTMKDGLLAIDLRKKSTKKN